MPDHWPDMMVAAANGVYLVNRDSQRLLLSGDGMYAGMSWSETALYVGARRYQPMDEQRGQPEQIQAIRSLNPLESTAFDYDGQWSIHQIFCHAGLLYVTAPARDAIDIIDLATGDISVWKWTPEDGHDDHHINSVWSDGKALWVCHNNFGDGRPGEILCFSMDRTLLGRLEIGSALHNVFVRDGHIFTCSSQEGRILRHDIQSGKAIESSLFDGVVQERYLRGMAATEESIFVGLSSINERSKRCDGDAWVARLSYDLKVQDVLALRYVGQIGEIRIVGEPDLAHNGIRCPALVGIER